MGKSAMIIINPSSGKEKAAEYDDRIKEVLQANYDEIEIQHTEGKGDATRFAQDAGRRGFDLVVSLGGDGTVNETINGLATQDNPPTLGIIPMGTVKMTDHLRNAHGYTINRKRVRRLMRLMDIIALYPGPNLSKRYHAKHVRPYLLRNLNIDHIDHVWGVDITYLPLKKGFMYLFVIIDWYSRQIVDYEISYSLKKSLLCAASKERSVAESQR